MKQLKVEIQVTLLAVIIAAAMIGSGYWVYHSLSRIVDSIHNETRPDFKLLLIKDIAADLNKIENTVRLYSLTGEGAFITSYRELHESIQDKLNNLKDYEIQGSGEIQLIDSIRILTTEKLVIWEKIRNLHNLKGDDHKSFTELYSKIDTSIIQADTITFNIEKTEKKGFFKRVFGKKDSIKAPPPVIIDKNEEKESLKKEIANIERTMSDRNRKLQEQEKELLEKNISVTALLDKKITKLESNEQQQLRTKTIEADFLAAQTYRRLTIFTIAAVVLLMVVLIIFFRNIQRNKAYQKLLRKAKAEAESLARAKEMFVATASHEMRTPVNAIFGITEQMLAKTHNKEMSADLEVVHKSAGNLITLINDTLDFSKIESQKLKISNIDFLPEEVFREVYILNKGAATAKGIRLIEANKTDMGLVLKGDPIRLKQILINIVSNAIKFTDHGEVHLTAGCKEQTDSRYLLTLEISDTGSGIPAKDIEKIFDEFVQLDNEATQKNRGTGLGLTIVKKLVELQGGTISVSSIPEKGTTFTVNIPYDKGERANIRKQLPEQLHIPQHIKKLQFLLVDDEEFNLYLLKNILNKWGVPFSTASDGQKAVSFAQKKHFDLIFMDLRMPVMNGYEASKRILQDNGDTKIIALTAANNPGDIRKSKEAGMAEHLQKPFTEAELLGKVIELFPGNSSDLDKDGKPGKESTPFEESIHQTYNSGDSIIDMHELDKMSGGDEVFLKELIDIFIKTSENSLNLLQENLQSENWEGIAEIAHKLAPPVKHMGAIQLYSKLKLLDQEARTGDDIPAITMLVKEINAGIIQINALLTKAAGNQ